MSQSIDLKSSFGRSPKRNSSREGSLNRSLEKLPKASLNLTYTMEKFVNQPILAAGPSSSHQQQQVTDDFDRESNTQELDAMMMDHPRM